MSSEATPISPVQFALAIENLPIETLYMKVAEIRNSIAHLIRSNQELEEYSASVGTDSDCVAAVRENGEVADRMKDRIELVRREVERRGQRWHEGEWMNGALESEGVAADQQDREGPQLAQRQAENDEEANQREEGLHL